jgi:hypothetical protein
MSSNSFSLSSSTLRHATSGVMSARRSESWSEHLNERARRFDEALHFMQEGHWLLSFACLAELADTGHQQAARLALLFVKRGSLLFGGNFRASDQRRAAWERCGG